MALNGYKPLVRLVPKLQFGNLWLTSSSLPCPVKQALQTPGSQAGAWEPAQEPGGGFHQLAEELVTVSVWLSAFLRKS